MNEQQAVLDFFAQPENLPLGLSVAEQMDEIRMQLNTQFWQALQTRLNLPDQPYHADFHTDIIEDRNESDMLVGVQCRPKQTQAVFLFPVLEQQYMGGKWRIFFGLMWNTPPQANQLALSAIDKLKTALLDAGFKNNENFLAWRWTTFYPRQSYFLMRFSTQADALLDEFEALLKPLLTEPLLNLANQSLRDAPRSMAISLDQLHRTPQR